MQPQTRPTIKQLCHPSPENCYADKQIKDILSASESDAGINNVPEEILEFDVPQIMAAWGRLRPESNKPRTMVSGANVCYNPLFRSNAKVTGHADPFAHFTRSALATLTAQILIHITKEEYQMLFRFLETSLNDLTAVVDAMKVETAWQASERVRLERKARRLEREERLLRKLVNAAEAVSDKQEIIDREEGKKLRRQWRTCMG